MCLPARVNRSTATVSTPSRTTYDAVPSGVGLPTLTAGGWQPANASIARGRRLRTLIGIDGPLWLRRKHHRKGNHVPSGGQEPFGGALVGVPTRYSVWTKPLEYDRVATCSSRMSPDSAPNN